MSVIKLNQLEEYSYIKDDDEFTLVLIDKVWNIRIAHEHGITHRQVNWHFPWWHVGFNLEQFEYYLTVQTGEVVTNVHVVNNCIMRIGDIETRADPKNWPARFADHPTVTFPSNSLFSAGVMVVREVTHLIKE